MARPRLSIDDYATGVLAGDRTVLGRAITLVESRRPSDQDLAQELLTRLLPHTGGAVRVGITGSPGVGKSTLLDSLGMHLVGQGHRVAVLAVDPSSSITGGSILGDKTRMSRLAVERSAFIRPSPSAASLGGVTRRTRETMLLCEAAGFDVVLVETVGVGQSETMVADMVDHFVVLTLPNSGDELQGIKKGVLELADVLAVNKADGDTLPDARRALRELQAALRYLRPRHEGWTPPTLMVSGLTEFGLSALWDAVRRHRDVLVDTGALETQRTAQMRHWMWAMIEERLLDAFRQAPAVQAELASLEEQVDAGSTTPSLAAAALLSAFGIEQ
ncbi:MAG: methylmalonyl Co-A mutase-associated GTPase MeaB [Deltaproteobacteria bacterium]|nr:methylmalonyl Co-A mutase-associated GTPase MeaB [Deltaproteobacteria bacterium]